MIFLEIWGLSFNVYVQVYSSVKLVKHVGHLMFLSQRCHIMLCCSLSSQCLNQTAALRDPYKSLGELQEILAVVSIGTLSQIT